MQIVRHSEMVVSALFEAYHALAKRDDPSWHWFSRRGTLSAAAGKAQQQAHAVQWFVESQYVYELLAVHGKRKFKAHPALENFNFYTLAYALASRPCPHS